MNPYDETPFLEEPPTSAAYAFCEFIGGPADGLRCWHLRYKGLREQQGWMYRYFPHDETLRVVGPT